MRSNKEQITSEDAPELKLETFEQRKIKIILREALNSLGTGKLLPSCAQEIHASEHSRSKLP
jgi:hypothetical protein